MAPTTSLAFIKTLDPGAGFATTSYIELDMSTVDNMTWNNFSLQLDVDGVALDGQILQFGWTTEATDYNDSGVYYDNLLIELDP